MGIMGGFVQNMGEYGRLWELWEFYGIMGGVGSLIQVCHWSMSKELPSQVQIAQLSRRRLPAARNVSREDKAWKKNFYICGTKTLERVAPGGQKGEEHRGLQEMCEDNFV